MKVKAIAAGFYGGTRYRIGEVFDVPESATGKWFVKADADAVAKSKVKQSKTKTDDPTTFGGIARRDSDSLV